ncbi:porin [Xanthobacter sp. V4C-4]|uniref:porin n=1 Tax=Xanthobacter cornucopiae TaxID=3119924 RepID=UPI0037299299
MLFILAVATSGALAQSKGTGGQVTSNCAALGEGFVRAPGSDTCVRMRGAVRAEVFTGASASNGGGFGNTATDLGGGTPVPASDPWKQTR